MQFMILFTRHPDKAETPTPSHLREAEFEKVWPLHGRFGSTDLGSRRRRRRLHDCGSDFD